MATYTGYVTVNEERVTWDSLTLSEQHIYGSSRVGMELANLQLYPSIPENPNMSDTGRYAIFEGWKRYEISNHLGNVLSVITDRKRGAAASGSQIQWFEADVVSAQQYYPFGMLMPGSATDSLRRQYTLGNNDYRYGFNGKEGDDEVKGDDNQQDYGMRIYDPRVGRFLSVDPIASQYPELTPYQFASNTPIQAIDLDGLEASVVRTIGQNGLPIIRIVLDVEIVDLSSCNYGVDCLKSIFKRKLLEKIEFRLTPQEQGEDGTTYEFRFGKVSFIENPQDKAGPFRMGALQIVAFMQPCLDV